MEMASRLLAESDIVSPRRRCPFVDVFTTVSLQWTSKKNIPKQVLIMPRLRLLKWAQL